MKQEFDAIAAQLQVYFDGLYHSDTLQLRRVLHPQARYVCATDEALVNIGMEEYFPIVDRRASPASRGEKRRDEIVSIEFAGPKTAFARVRCAVGERHFTDFLTFIKTNAEWQIISKVFHYDLRDAQAAQAN
ncbi:nuclear transport factor 2 family protein [Parvibaculum sp.]|uniref:nuclear transport factor 2 family protein n=1 Tax=Parvibaculum sp. TaxID=2024848 RepID=UPI001B29F81F|nr:nuclear transport factor 2 family protein [Parvibaculum sp.]MBO6634770.1 nuclear transport factor 2 family protein [Parvibaculum sp.]MBO6677915.1 nuclear transport factor 2 family protein [Parvibaculum sp.]MBO6683389.1 nuclear transport factor 2 family protein [Parvibaculum sp.]MBO6906484.1 nuclear transport factor 2 family protein [Parvibaculum sp.]